MNDPDKIDFGALDPSRDAARWQRLVARTAERAREHHARRARMVSSQLVAWARPVCAFAAAACLLVWSATWWRQERSARATEAALRAEQASLLLKWAVADEVPPPEVLLQMTGADDAAR